jgi:hypothetical protein
MTHEACAVQTAEDHVGTEAHSMLVNLVLLTSVSCQAVSVSAGWRASSAARGSSYVGGTDASHEHRATMQPADVRILVSCSHTGCQAVMCKQQRVGSSKSACVLCLHAECCLHMQAATTERLPYPPLVWQPPLVVDEAMLVACATRVRDYSDCRHTRFSPSSPERLHSGALERLDVHEVLPVG